MLTNHLTEKFQEYLSLSAQMRPDYTTSLGTSGDITRVVPEAPELLKTIYSTVSGTSSNQDEPSLVEFIPGYRLIHIEEYEQEQKVLLGILEEKGYTAGGRSCRSLRTMEVILYATTAQRTVWRRCAICCMIMAIW